MNKILTAVTAASLCLFISSCKNSIPHEHRVVTEWQEVTPVPVPLTNFDDRIGLLGIYKAGDYTLWYQYKQDYLFCVYDKDNNLMGELFRRGRGANEFLSLSYFGQCTKEDDGTKVWMLDGIKKQLLRINIEESLKSGIPVVDKEFNLARTGDLEVRNLFYINDNLLLGTDDRKDCRIFTIDPVKRDPLFFEHYPSFDLYPHVHDISQNMVTIKPDGSLIASSFFSLPQVDLIKPDGETYFSVFFDRVPDPKRITSEESDDLECFLQVVSTDKYVFLLSADIAPDGKQTIFVIDWNGNPVLKLNVEPATFFCMKDDGTIYCFNFNTDKEVVTAYDISAYI